MKFVSGIIAGLLASSEAYRIGNKKVDARKLMQSAVQVDPKTMRKLQNNNNENGFQITNAHSIRFNSCTSLKTNGGDNQAADQEQQDGQDQQAADGQQQDGEQQADGQQDGADQQGEQQADGQQQDGADQQGEGQQDGAEQGQEGGQRRKLQNNNNFEVIDCDVCEARNCFAAADDQQEQADGNVAVNDENIVAWVEGIAQCQQTASYWDAFPLYAGFICNGDGSGVEIGLFLDEECSIYTSSKSYKNVVGDDDKQLFYNSQEIVTYPFLHSVSCGNQVEYITPDEYENMQANGNDGNNGENDNGEASELCRELMNGQAINLYDCNADGKDDEVDNEIQEDQEAGYGWYAYTITSENAENSQAVCKILQTMEGEYTVVYNSNEKHGSGTFYDYSTKSGFQKRKGLFVTFIVLGVVAIVAGVFVVQGSKGSKGKRGDSLL